MKACQYFLKLLAVFYTTALPHVPVLINEWTMAYAPGEIRSLKQAHSWTHKTKDDFTWSYWPTHGHHQGMGIGRARCSSSCLHPTLGSQHLLQAHWQSIQHSPASHLNNYFLIHNGPGALPELYTKSLLKNLLTSYHTAYAIVLPLSHTVCTSFYTMIYYFSNRELQ